MNHTFSIRREEEGKEEGRGGVGKREREEGEGEGGRRREEEGGGERR